MFFRFFHIGAELEGGNDDGLVLCGYRLDSIETIDPYNCILYWNRLRSLKPIQGWPKDRRS